MASQKQIEALEEAWSYLDVMESRIVDGRRKIKIALDMLLTNDNGLTYGMLVPSVRAGRSTEEVIDFCAALPKNEAKAIGDAGIAHVERIRKIGVINSLLPQLPAVLSKQAELTTDQVNQLREFVAIAGQERDENIGTGFAIFSPELHPCGAGEILDRLERMKPDERERFEQQGKDVLDNAFILSLRHEMDKLKKADRLSKAELELKDIEESLERFADFGWELFAPEIASLTPEMARSRLATLGEDEKRRLAEMGKLDCDRITNGIFFGEVREILGTWCKAGGEYLERTEAYIIKRLERIGGFAALAPEMDDKKADEVIDLISALSGESKQSLALQGRAAFEMAKRAAHLNNMLKIGNSYSVSPEKMKEYIESEGRISRTGSAAFALAVEELSALEIIEKLDSVSPIKRKNGVSKEKNKLHG